MNLHRGQAVVPDGSGLLCRQSRVGGVFSLLVFGGIFSVPAVLLIWRGSSWLAIVPCVLLALFTIWLLYGDARLRFRAENWVLWLSGDQVWVNLRSYQDQSDLESPSVIELSTREIAEVRRRTERYTTPSSKGGSVRQKLISLEIVLNQADDGYLSEALADVRAEKQPWTHVAGMQSTHRVTLNSVSLPAANVIRIAWSGGQGHGVSPRLDRVLEVLQERVRLGDTQEIDAGDWTNLPDAGLDDEVLDLVSKGHGVAAIRLLTLRRGMSLTDARNRVDKLSRRRDCDQS